MSSPSAPAADSLVADLRAIFRERLRSIVIYGAHAEGPASSEPLTCLALVTTLDIADLDACARAGHGWGRHGFATPLILPEAEFRRSLDAFPLEYSEMMRAHVVVHGSDPFAGLTLDPQDLRRACETQVKSHLLHLREEYIETGGRPQAIAELVQASAPSFAVVLRLVARLHGVDASDRGTATREGARIAALPEGVVGAVLALEHPSGVGSTDPARLFPEYLAAVERLATFVDSWRG